jgi:hypothetical protein
MVAQKAHTKRILRYGSLTNIQLVLDANGLANGVNNSYGEVDGSNNIVSFKGISPGGILDTFGVIGSGLTFDPTTKSIAYNGSGRLRSTGAASLYDFLSYNAVYNNLKWSAFFVCKIGTSIMPTNVQYGLFGNNGSASANKGAAGYYANNSSMESALLSFITRGTSAQYLGRIFVPGGGPSNQWCVVAFVFDPTEGSQNYVRIYVNDQTFLGFEQLGNNTSPVTTPSFPLEIGGVGNGGLPFVGNIKKVIITSSATSYVNVITTIRLLMNENNITRVRTSDNLNTTLVPAMFSTDDEAAYKLSAVFSQDPTNPYRVFLAYTKGTNHLFNAGRKIVGRRSLNKAAEGVSFGNINNIFDPVDPQAVADLGGGFDQNGIFHLFTDINTSFSAGGYVGVRHIYSSDLSSWTNTDITAALAADGLLAARMYGNMIHVGGVWMKPYYKLTDEGNFTQSANYIFRSTDGINWTSVTVRAPAATYINEASIFWLGGNTIGYLARNEVTLEWSLSISTDLGLTWDAFTDVTFGETVSASPSPPMVKTFTHNGVLLISAYVTNRPDNKAFVVYGKAADIIASRGAGFNLNTKICWWQTDLDPYHLHYGDIIHIDGTLRAVSAYAYDTFPPGGGALNSMRIYTMPTWYVSKLETELAI